MVRELGRGGMATVYLAADVKLGRRVAIKVLPPTTRSYLGSGRFQREVLFAAQLSHPHIVPLFEADEADGLLFYAMEYVEGESLKDRLTRDGPLPVEEAIRITAEVGDALQYAHETGVIHRDIKPGNILLSRGHAVVSDFGIAKVVAESGATTDGTSITGTGITVGTAEYMSPEQASGEKRIDARSDVYGLAAVLYEMLAGEPPFTGPSVQAVVARVLTDSPRPIHTVRPNLPAHIERALGAGLAKLPPARRHPCRSAMDGATGRELAGHRRPLGGGASVLPVARRRGTASHGSGVGSGRRGPKRDGVPLGQLLGARPRQRGGGNRQLQAGWLVPSRAVGGRRPGPDRQRVGVGCGGDAGVERAGSPRDQGRRLRHAAQECGDPRSQLVPRGSASGLEDRFPVRTAQVTRPPEPVGPRVRISATMKHVWLIAAALFGGCQPQARRLLLLDLALSDPVALHGTARPCKDAGHTVRDRRFYPHLTRADLGQYRTLVFLLGREPEAPSDALTV